MTDNKKQPSITQGSPWLKEAYAAFAPVRQHMGQYSEAEINDAIDQAVKAVRSGKPDPGVIGAVVGKAPTVKKQPS